ncbi:MAG: mechanosensitive ion channel protein MscS [Oceanospirillaceae bacterium]|nr:mechanosensitive ion channel protein MscS [Oceanospirillaceae bacterium]MBT11421.1 mechanosensitive ion channel protein MscS [Oceanospirillaceae bacterium]
MRTCLSLILILLLPGLAQAAQTGTDLLTGGAAVSSEESGQDVSEEQLDELISTLENDAERQQLIDQLQLLSKAREQEPENPLDSLTEALDIEATGSGLAGEFVDMLQSWGLSESFIGALFSFVLTLLLIAVCVFINNRLAILFDRRMRKVRNHLHLAKRRFHSLFTLQRWAGYLFGLIFLVYATSRLFTAYIESDSDYSLPLGALFSTGLTLVVILFVWALIWEGVNAFLEIFEYKNRRLKKARLKTVTPIIRNVLLFTLSLFAIMIILSELGVDILPLVAGAGVLGIAIGFGAQTLVKDFITGAMVIFEDLLQIDDVVQLGDKFGVVEKITIRKIQLRDLDGTVHTVPFGDVTIVSNLTKDFSYYLFNVGVAYREDVDEVMQCLRDIDEELRQDKEFGRLILEPLEILGLDKFADSALIIKARTKTLPHEKWTVGREFNRRMKRMFDERNIEIPFPHQTLYFGEDKSGQAPSANVRLLSESVTNRSSANEDGGADVRQEDKD